MRPNLSRSVIELHLTARERRQIDSRLARAYQDEADALLAEIEDLLDVQSWPSD